MTEKIAMGDVVQLRSGGQEMTVIEVAKDYICCQWFTKSGTLKTNKFSPTCLQKQEPAAVNLRLLET